MPAQSSSQNSTETTTVVPPSLQSLIPAYEAILVDFPVEQKKEFVAQLTKEMKGAQAYNGEFTVFEKYKNAAIKLAAIHARCLVYKNHLEKQPGYEEQSDLAIAAEKNRDRQLGKHNKLAWKIFLNNKIMSIILNSLKNGLPDNAPFQPIEDVLSNRDYMEKMNGHRTWYGEGLSCFWQPKSTHLLNNIKQILDAPSGGEHLPKAPQRKA